MYQHFARFTRLGSSFFLVIGFSLGTEFVTAVAVDDEHANGHNEGDFMTLKALEW